jgi:hypothetical protein
MTEEKGDLPRARVYACNMWLFVCAVCATTCKSHTSVFCVFLVCAACAILDEGIYILERRWATGETGAPGRKEAIR